MSRLDGKVAIVTGAGGGIGLEYARRFLQEGAKVAVAEVDDDRCRSAAEELAELGDVEPVPTDIADESSVEACVDATRERFGGLDVLVNNAAIYGNLDIADQSLDYLRRVFDVNLHGQWLMARAAAPHLVAQRYGRIVNIASIAAFLHQINAFDSEFNGLLNYAYAQSKWGVVGLTRHLAGQLGQFNVTVNCIAPGLTMTEATKAVVPDFAHPFFEQLSPMRRNCEAAELTGVALFFASDDAALVNGQILCVDGGTVMPV
jgi:3-oxoacyl-[acyl-carrier protein] reductase